ncbi:MAG TPA: Hsp20/alpha crystallin family protein [Coleofasciculaceae cyanobacterium]
MVALQSWHALDIFHFLFRSFHDLKQNAYESTLWVCDSGASQPFTLDLQETGTLLILKIQFHHSENSLDLRITPETVLVRGNRLDPLDQQDLSPASRFQSLIPLPISIQPQTAIAELSDNTLMLTLMKSHKTQQTAKITVGDRSQRLPYAMAITATSATPEWN